MDTFLSVTLDLLQGFWMTFKVFGLTLVFALPLGLIMSFLSMSKVKIVSAVMRTFIWIIVLVGLVVGATIGAVVPVPTPYKPRPSIPESSPKE